MWWQAAVLFVLLLPQVGHSDVLTFGVWPSSNPASGVSCRIDLKSGQINVVEVRGAGMPPKSPLRWPVRRGECVRSDLTRGPSQWRFTQRRSLPVAVAPGMVAKAGVLQTSGVAVNLATGTVPFAAAPGVGQALKWGPTFTRRPTDQEILMAAPPVRAGSQGTIRMKTV